MTIKAAAAIRTLERMGYTYIGGRTWTPPPKENQGEDPLNGLIANIDELERLTAVATDQGRRQNN